jgi:hypothetical protein
VRDEHPRSCAREFQTLLRAAENGDLSLMQCTEISTGEIRYVICAVGRAGADYVFTPFGHLADGDPFELYRPPDSTP